MYDGAWTNKKKRFLNKISNIDSSFCTTHPSSLKNLQHKNIFFIPNPVDRAFENLNNYKNKNFKYDFFFALSHGVHRGTLKKGKIDNREKFLKKIMSTSSEIRFNIIGLDNNQPVWAEEFKSELSKSKMALNLSQGSPLKFYSSDRLVQLIGNGVLTFVNIKTRLNKLFTNKEVIFYKDSTELVKKIIKYKNLDKERIKIAKNGMKKYHSSMNSKQVASFMINKHLI